ncbi:MAG: nucleotidyl transferase AbiEii/AbiGii toxin family protein [Bacteroidales bacterium]|nr:nucleotidyl transferase AbiEii/AbiGii toxin family protein [Bacteroidales bacterium]
MKFIDIEKSEQRQILDNLQTKIGLKSAIIEKDWWVTAVLRALFQLSYSQHFSFKGGTSLSKCWQVIQRMSEDADIGITREYLGFEGKLSKTQISDRLRRAACSFVRDTLQYDLREQMIKDGINPKKFKVYVNITSVSTTDPEVIYVEYEPTASPVSYIPPVVKIEVSGRSMSEPTEDVLIESFIDGAVPDAIFAEPKFPVRVVMAKRTFLEKIFLLHEEFAKKEAQIRVDRMSRHLYDVHRMLLTPIAEEALRDHDLYDTVIEHRKTFIGLKGFDYSTLAKSTLTFIPPESVYHAWKKDYEAMQEEMIYGESLPFDNMITELRKFNKQINENA